MYPPFENTAIKIPRSVFAISSPLMLPLSIGKLKNGLSPVFAPARETITRSSWAALATKTLDGEYRAAVARDM